MSSALLAEASVANAFTLRPEDLRVVGGSDARRADDRRERLCQALGGDPALLTWMEQVHGHAVAVIDPARAGRQIDGADGLVTAQQGVTLLALSADCPVVTVADPGRSVLGIAHAGWRGTLRGITRNLVQAMVQRFACRPADLLAAVSPSAGPDRYQIGDDVLQLARHHLSDPDRFLIRRGDSLFLDLWSANVVQLTEAGLEPERIDLARMCTIGDERFFSYRRDGPATGHAAMLAVLG
jgi:YfiH family protein